MLPITNTNYEDSVLKISDSLKESESYIRSIEKQLEDGNKLSTESKILFRSILSKLEQSSEMSNMDKLKSIFDNTYIKDTINEQITDKIEREKLLEAFSSLRSAVLKSTSFTSILTGVLRKSIGNATGMIASQMDLPPIVTFMATRLGDLFGTILQNRRDKKERKIALEEKIKEEKERNIPLPESSPENNDNSSPSNIPVSQDKFLPVENISPLYDKLTDEGKAFVNEFKLGIQDELNTVLKSGDFASILKLLQEQDTILNKINSELEGYILENKDSFFKKESILDSVKKDDYNRTTIELLSDISESNKKSLGQQNTRKNKEQSIFDKVASFITKGFSSLFVGLGKVLFTIGNTLSLGMLSIFKDFSISAIKTLAPSILSSLASPAVLSTLLIAAAGIANKFIEDANKKLDKHGLAAANEGETTNSTSIDPMDSLNEPGKEGLKKFQSENNFSKMSIKDQTALAWYKLTNNTDKQNEILEKYNIPKLSEDEKKNLIEKQSRESKTVYSNIERILSDSENEKILNKNSYVLQKELQNTESVLNGNTKGSSSSNTVVSPMNISSPQTNMNINNISNITNSSILSKTTLMSDPGLHYALGASFR